MRPLLLFLLLLPALLPAQSLYFPPAQGDDWATTEPAALGWDTAALPAFYDYLEESNTKGLLVLHEGRIVLERYFGSFTQDSVWYWASAGKSLTAMLVGQALHDGLIDLDAPTSDYLGVGWTGCSAQQESAITIRHQLSMVTGLDPRLGDCLSPACLQCLFTPATRWFYHNAPYRKLRQVVEAATGQNYNAYTRQQLIGPIGGRGWWVIDEDQLLYVSTPRTMARFGLLMLAQGNWAGTQVQRDQNYISLATSPSQADNPSYGYLWWLNGQQSYRLPGSPDSYPGMLDPNLPPDAYAALGANGQQLDVVPSMGLIVVRMGDAPDVDVVSTIGFTFHREFWSRLRPIIDGTTSVTAADGNRADRLVVSPNPTTGRLQLHTDPARTIARLRVVDATGRTVHQSTGETTTLDLGHLRRGTYLLSVRYTDGSRSVGRVVLR